MGRIKNIHMQILKCQVSATYLLYVVKKRRRWWRRKWWVHPINRQRLALGHFTTLFEELKNDPEKFFRYTRMSQEVFYELLETIAHLLQKRSHRESISPAQRLLITLRYLATGDQMFTIALAFRIGESTARNIIKETCEAIITVLTPIYLAVPTKEDWENIALGFLSYWNFPNCIGAIDGKHIQIQAPSNTGSLFFNYKKTFSIVLMAAVDDKYKFTLVDIGACGSENDAGILLDSTFGKAIYYEPSKINLPSGVASLPGSNSQLPCVFVGDSIFQMHKHVMKPYAGKFLPARSRIFNYRLSRARRVSENAFGILASRWRLLRKSIGVLPDVCEKLVSTCILLHNFLMSKRECAHSDYCPPTFVDRINENGTIIDGEWRNDGGNIGQINIDPPHRAARATYKIRDTFADYFLTPSGEVPWQYEHVSRGSHR